jgi:hypothetical protein
MFVATVTVPQSQTLTTFDAETDVVMSDQNVTVAATAGSSHINGRLRLLKVPVQVAETCSK